MRGVLLYAWWLERKIFPLCIYFIYIYIYPWIPVTQEGCLQAQGLVCCWSNLTLLRSLLKQIGLVSFFFYFMDLSDVVYIIWILKALNDFRLPNKMAFFMLAAGFTFGGHLSIWKIYELEQQFPKLAPWNMHSPTVHFFQQCFVLVLPDKYEQKLYGNLLAVKTLAEWLSVKSIFHWSRADADLYKSQDFHVLVTTYLSYTLAGKSESRSFEVRVLQMELFWAAFKSGFPTSFFPKWDFLYQILLPTGNLWRCSNFKMKSLAI